MPYPNPNIPLKHVVVPGHQPPKWLRNVVENWHGREGVVHCEAPPPLS